MDHLDPSVSKEENMTKLSTKRDIQSLALLCAFAYFISYVSRINLSAVMVEVVASGFAPRTTVALALTVNSVTYGCGQLVSGYLGDRHKPQNIVFTGFLLAGCINICVGLLPVSAPLVVLWGINGFAQALMWPPIVKILVTHMDNDAYAASSVKVSYGGNIGSVAVYLCAPLVITLFSFRGVFLISGILALAMALTWKLIYNKKYASVSVSAPVPGKKADPVPPTGHFTGGIVALLVIVMLTVVLQGALRDGVASWVPTYISDVFHLDSSVSILTGAILPVFSILSIAVANLLYRKVLRNEMLCSAVIFAVGCVSAVLLFLFSDSSPILSVLFLALLSGSMHGVNLMLTCMVPPHFARYGRTALVSGTLNSCTYAGAAVSTYGIALFTESYGWDGTILLWAGIALTGTTVCVLILKTWKSFRIT